MLRHLYRRLIAFHPPYFRKRFGDEMLSIFDQAGTSFVKIRLLSDLMVSLARQWIFRPQFWHEPALRNPIPASGAPEFLILEDFRPRTGALIDGALLSAMIFTMVCFAMGYAWNHPVLIRIVQPYWKISRGAATAQASTSRVPPPAPLSPESPVYTPEGRVVLVFPSSRVNMTPDAAVLPRMASVGEATLASYVGTYRTDSGQPVFVKLTGNEFGIQEIGLPSMVLTPISETRFVSRSQHDYLVSFHANPSGVFDSLEIIRNGTRITAHRK
jgi:hypothetical protein